MFLYDFLSSFILFRSQHFIKSVVGVVFYVYIFQFIIHINLYYQFKVSFDLLIVTNVFLLLDFIK